MSWLCSSSKPINNNKLIIGFTLNSVTSPSNQLLKRKRITSLNNSKHSGEFVLRCFFFRCTLVSRHFYPVVNRFLTLIVYPMFFKCSLFVIPQKRSKSTWLHYSSVFSNSWQDVSAQQWNVRLTLVRHGRVLRHSLPFEVGVENLFWEQDAATPWCFISACSNSTCHGGKKRRLALITAQFRQVPGWGWKWTNAHSNTRLACDASSINKRAGFPATQLQCVVCN